MTYFTQEQAVEMVVQIGADVKDCPWAILTPEELTALVNIAAERAVEAAVGALIAAAYLDAAEYVRRRSITTRSSSRQTRPHATSRYRDKVVDR